MKKLSKAQLAKVLTVKVDTGGRRLVSLREACKALLLTVIKEGEGFSGKRPFGNSGWEYEWCEAVANALGLNSHDLAHDAIRQAVESLFVKPAGLK